MRGRQSLCRLFSLIEYVIAVVCLHHLLDEFQAKLATFVTNALSLRKPKWFNAVSSLAATTDIWKAV